MDALKAEPKWRRAYSEGRAAQYDAFIQAGAMNYDGALQAVMEMAVRGSRAPKRILELGAGTGGLTGLLLDRFPSADVVAVDGSPEMLERARRKLQSRAVRLSLMCSSFEDLCGKTGALGTFDLIVSAFALHHMDHARLRSLFGELRCRLAPSGRLIVADYVLSNGESLQRDYEDVWVEYRWRNMEPRLGVKMERSEVASLHELTKREEGDNPADLDEMLSWLRGAGYADVGCHWKHFCFAVYGGSRGA